MSTNPNFTLYGQNCLKSNVTSIIETMRIRKMSIVTFHYYNNHNRHDLQCIIPYIYDLPHEEGKKRTISNYFIIVLLFFYYNRALSHSVG